MDNILSILYTLCNLSFYLILILASCSYRIIQFGSHYFSQIEGITKRYCQMRETLGKTHKMVYGEAWGWERWDRS